MNKPSKLGVLGGRRSSEAEAEMKRTTTKTTKAKTKTKTNPSPRRSPLTDINGDSRPPLSGSGEAPRSGCFGFLLSNSSSSSSSSSSKNPIARSNPTLSTPRSAPPNPRTLPSRNPRNPPKKTTRPMRSKNPSPELSFEVGFHGNGATTPEKAKEAEAKPSLISPRSGTSTTPPIQASISPEVPCASSVAPTPVCFAAGHVVAGVHDRRKCRPRGILAIGRGEPAESVELREKRFDDSLPPPLAGASIHWLSSSPGDPSSSFSSYSNKAHCEAEASVNWLLPPCEDGEESINKEEEEEFILPKCSFSATNFPADLWRFAHTDASPLQTTPSSGLGIQKTPATDSSLSPFSMILKRASKSSMPKLPRAQQEGGGYRYGSNAERSPFSGESSWTGNTCNINSTAKQTPNFSVHEVDSISEVLESISCLSSKRMDSDEASLLALSGHSFRFGRQETAFNSIDLSCFRKSVCDNSISGRKVSSAMRISWREGLVSRIFEMGELDCCQWLSDDEDEFDHERISLSKDGGNREAACGFGSVEFICSGSGHNEGDAIISSGPISCSESISTEGAELISSDDSNWTLFYKNNLFAV